MAEPSLVFPADEFRARTARLQDAMADRHIDALLLTAPADIFYLTGFLTRFWESPARPWFVLVPSAHPPVAVIPSIGAILMGRSWIADIRTWEAPHPDDDGVNLLADTIAEFVPKRGILGLPMGRETHLRMPLDDFHRLAAVLDPCRLVDATEVVQRIREVKSGAEIAKIGTICRMAGEAFSATGQSVRAGMPLDRIFRDFQIQLLQAGADWVSYVAGAAGRDGYKDVISPATSEPLAEGDVLMLDTGAVKDGYFCDFDRNLFIGAPTSAVMHTYDALWGATEDALETLRPGLRACDAYRMLAEGLERRGARPCTGRFGHGVGISLTEWPSLAPHDTTELREGMVLAIEPSAFVGPETFLVHEENVVLRADGPELLSHRAPRHVREVAL
ncbi:MAG: Xaa-Pro peptidase family protein [Pseudomonadota bacterium]